MDLKKVFSFIKNDITKLKKEEKESIWKIKDKSDFVFLMSEKLIDHSSEIDNFTDSEKIFYVCSIFDSEAQSNGSFYSCYTSDIGAYVYELPSYFKEIGFDELGLIIDKVNSLFEKKLSSDQTEREEYIDSVYEDIEDKMNEYFDEYCNNSNDLYMFLYDYAMKNKDDFKIVD